MAQTAVCNRHHSLDQQLCRWLLLSLDRLQGSELLALCEEFVSLVSVVDGSPGVEVGMVGSEGMVGAQLALGMATAPLHGVVQVDGAAWRIKAADMRRLLTKSEALKATLDQYLYVLMAQLATESNE